MNYEFFTHICARISEALDMNINLTIKTSWIPKANLGLYAKSFIRKGQVVTCYKGEILATRDAIKLKDKSYLMRIGNNCYIDANYSKYSLARYINDCRNIQGYNVMFLKCKIEACAWVISLRDISVGEELFVDYGKWYWAGIDKDSISNLSYFKLNKLISGIKG
jgi:SET domain-containing protein